MTGPPSPTSLRAVSAPSAWAERASAVSTRSRVCVMNGVPLCAITRWNNPAASGESISVLQSTPPADSPKIVTFPGSPPNPATLACTHFNAAIWSSKP